MPQIILSPSLLNTFSFIFLHIFHLSTRFLSILTCLSLEQFWIFSITFDFVSKFPFFVLFRMLWMLVTVDSLKYTACHRSLVPQVTSWKTLHSKLYLVCPMKLDWYWSHVSLVTVCKWCIKNYWKSLQNQWREVEEETEWQLHRLLCYIQAQKINIYWP